MTKPKNLKPKERDLFSDDQVAKIIQWLAEGLTTKEINQRSAECKPPFAVTPQEAHYYRLSRHIDVEQARYQRESEIMNSGFALKENRVLALNNLAVDMSVDLKDDNKRWLERQKSIGSGANAITITEIEFNSGEVREFRGVLEDISKETGGRQHEAEYHPPFAKSVEGPGFVLPADIISSEYTDVYRDIREGNHTEYLFKGGRGSLKSTFVSEAIIDLLLNNPGIHALATRQVANTLRDSVYSQFLWTIDKLNLNEYFKCTLSPMQMEYLPTNQFIYFRGADDPAKLKSIKTPHGYIGILWMEELDQYRGQEAVRKIEQSVIRGGDRAWIFKSFNPPKSTANWVNKYVLIPKKSQYQHSSTYLTVPPEWLGQAWLDEANHLKLVNPNAYDHEYLGVVNGTGGQVFDNIKVRKITDEEIKQFDRIHRGIDWGWFPDPFAYVKCHFDAARLKLYIFDELKLTKKSNRQAYDILTKKKGLKKGDLVIADSAEPKSISDMLEYGMMIRGAEKGPESVAYSIKWLQSLVEIVIDPGRAPESATEFTEYELEMDKDGEYISAFPDKNNHFIDGTRYSTNLIWRRRGQ